MLANVFLIRVHRAPIRDLYLSEISSTRKIIIRGRSRSLQFLLPSTFYLQREKEREREREKERERERERERGNRELDTWWKN